LPKTVGIKVRHDGTELFIPTVKQFNQGTYRCSIRADNNPSARVTPFVTYEVVVESEPVFAEKPEDTVVPLLGSVVLHCAPDQVNTRPKATVSWLVNGKPITTYLDGIRKRLLGNVR
ncbi:hypothetical protein EG68_00281, partial [Paragonimus skrjabini miyazakii]